MDLTPDQLKKILQFQKNEITEYHIYLRLAARMPSEKNRKILKKIAEDELRHYGIWMSLTKKEVRPARIKVFYYCLIHRIFGFTFAVKLMENAEEGAQESYQGLSEKIPQADAIFREETEHERALISILDEERLKYLGSMVLGLNDALVELTGVLAGLTLALRNTRLIALSGLITGIAAALSMGASEYLSVKSEDTHKNPLKASLYTGTTYLITVMVLILPYLVLRHYTLCLAVTLTLAVLIIALFNYYISVARDLRFRKRFLEMAGLSLGVAGLSFMVGYVLRMFLPVEI